MKCKKILALILTATLTAGLLTACGKKESGQASEPPTPETVAPLNGEVQTDYTDDPALLAQVNALKASFANIVESDPGAFDITVQNGTACITRYKGSAKNVCVPEKINGTSVTAIGDSAFSGHTGIESLYIPDSVTRIGVDVLKGCDNLISLRTPLPAEEEKQFLGYLFGSDSHEDNARDVPAALKYLELGGNAHRLADFALFDCNDLVCVTLPKSMTEIGSYALYHCSSLLELNTAHLTRLAEHALDSCSALTVLTFGKELTSIGLGALEGCDALRSLTLPFVGGTPLENQYLGYVFGAEVPDHANGFYPTYLSAVEVLDGCIMLGGYAFYECETLTKVTLPETLTEIGIRAFAGCKRLIGLSFPDALKTIRENAFFDCISLQTVAFGDSSALSTLGINAFYNCYALTSVILPESLKSLPASCFACCLDLETVDFGGVTEVGKNAFRHCISLKNAVAPSDISLEEGNDSIEAILFAKQ